MAHARFYGQQWQTNPTNGGVSNTPIGNSFLIGETAIDPIPPFNSLTPNAPLNWSFASVNFDTTPYKDVYLTFFVIVWMEVDNQGSKTIVSEMPSHGLINFDPGKPINSFADLAAFEEEYGNNIGFYNSAFYVFDKPASASGSVNKTLSKTSNGTNASMVTELHLTEVKTSSSSIKPGQRLEITATLKTGTQGVTGVSVYFYDGEYRQWRQGL